MNPTEILTVESCTFVINITIRKLELKQLVQLSKVAFNS